MNRRVYDPAIGRFMSADPFIDDGAGRQGLNRFSYVGNNPLSFTDPSGYERTCDWVYYEQIGIPLPNGVRTETKYPTFECPDPSDPPPGVGSGAGAAENGSDDKVELSTVDSHECTIFDFIEDVKNAVREGIHDLPNVSVSFEIQGAFGLDSSGEYSQYSVSVGINSLLQVFAQTQGSSSLRGEGDIAALSVGLNGGFAMRAQETGVNEVDVGSAYGYIGPGMSAGYERGAGSGEGSLPDSALPSKVRGGIGRVVGGVGLAAGYVTGTAKEFTGSTSALLGLIERPKPYSGCGGRF